MFSKTFSLPNAPQREIRFCVILIGKHLSFYYFELVMKTNISGVRCLRNGKAFRIVRLGRDEKILWDEERKALNPI